MLKRTRHYFSKALRADLAPHNHCNHNVQEDAHSCGACCRSSVRSSVRTHPCKAKRLVLLVFVCELDRVHHEEEQGCHEGKYSHRVLTVAHTAKQPPTPIRRDQQKNEQSCTFTGELAKCEHGCCAHAACKGARARHAGNSKRRKTYPAV